MIALCLIKQYQSKCPSGKAVKDYLVNSLVIIHAPEIHARILILEMFSFVKRRGVFMVFIINQIFNLSLFSNLGMFLD